LCNSIRKCQVEEIFVEDRKISATQIHAKRPEQNSQFSASNIFATTLKTYSIVSDSVAIESFSLGKNNKNRLLAVLTSILALCAIKKLFLAAKWEHPAASNCTSAELRFPRLATLVGSSSHAKRRAYGITYWQCLCLGAQDTFMSHVYPV